MTLGLDFDAFESAKVGMKEKYEYTIRNAVESSYT